MIQGLRTVIYQVDDISRAKDWYSSVLGFTPYFDEPFYVGFNVGGGFELGLDPNGGDAAVKGSNAVAYWSVNGIENAFERLLKLGAESASEITDVGEGIKVATVKDPFGNIFGIIESPHFKIEN